MTGVDNKGDRRRVNIDAGVGKTVTPDLDGDGTAAKALNDGGDARLILRSSFTEEDRPGKGKGLSDAFDVPPTTLKTAGSPTSLAFGGASEGSTLGRFRLKEFDAGPLDGAKILKGLAGDGTVAKLFDPNFKASSARRSLRKELESVPGMNGTNVRDLITKHPLLSDKQKLRIFDVLAEVRESFMNRAESDSPTDYQVVNWHHTRAEVAFVLAAAEKNGLNAEQIEDAVLASAFSDAVKSPANFITHHVQGAEAAAAVLPKYFDVDSADDLERLLGIQSAILEHQIAPPKFMSMMLKMSLGGVAQLALKNSVVGDTVGKHLGDGQQLQMWAQDRLQTLKDWTAGQVGDDAVIEQTPEPGRTAIAAMLADFTQDGAKELGQHLDSLLASITAPQKITEPLKDGPGGEIAFTPVESQLLEDAGLAGWHTPDVDTAHNAASRSVIDGDGMVNYTTPAGFSKIVAIRGPETAPFFEDPLVEDSMQSCMESFTDASTVMTPEALELSHKNLDITMAAWAEVQDEIDAWIVDLGDKVPNADGGGVAFWTAPLIYPGNEGFDQAQFDFAKEVREQVVTRLAAKQEML